MPAIKANFTLALRHILTQEGTGCDVFGAGELEAALRCGVPPEHISLNSPVKNPALLERAVLADVRITLDTMEELQQVREAARRARSRARVRFRVRPDLRSLEQPSDFFEDGVTIGMATQVYKAGIPTEDLVASGGAALRMDEVEVTGATVHIGRHGTDPDIWREVARGFVSLIAKLRDLWDGWEPRELNVGGGFPVPRDPFGRATRRAPHDEHVPSVSTYARVIAETLRDELGRAGISTAGKTLEVEPGRRLYGNAGIHLATVQHVKRQTEPVARSWVQTDSSNIYLADVVLERNRWTSYVANRADAPATQTTDINGNTCSWDVIVPEARLPRVGGGDVLAFLDTGAYQDASASNFNALPRPATLLVHGEEAEIVKRAETIEEVFQRDVLPERLSRGGLAPPHPDRRALPTERESAPTPEEVSG
jgi:diaminopimelate decarboxylase